MVLASLPAACFMEPQSPAAWMIAESAVRLRVEGLSQETCFWRESMFGSSYKAQVGSKLLEKGTYRCNIETQHHHRYHGEKGTCCEMSAWAQVGTTSECPK